jgi:hypothetical protein
MPLGYGSNHGTGPHRLPEPVSGCSAGHRSPAHDWPHRSRHIPALPGDGAKHIFMVRPAWVADPDAFSAGLVGDEVSCHTQAAGAPGGLRGARTLVGNDWTLFAEQQLLRAVGESGDALNAEIVFGGFIFQQILLSFFHAGQHRRFGRFRLCRRQCPN